MDTNLNLEDDDYSEMEKCETSRETVQIVDTEACLIFNYISQTSTKFSSNEQRKRQKIFTGV